MSLENKLESKGSLFGRFAKKLVPFAIAASTLLTPSDATAYKTVPEGQSNVFNSSVNPLSHKVCHRDLSLEIVYGYKRKKTKVGEDLKNDGLAIELVQGAIDEDDITLNEGMRFVQHFYNPSRNENNDGLKVRLLNDGSKDALSRAKKLWENAVSLYKQDEKKKAYHTLGRVLHLLEDMGCPEHVYLINHGPRLEKIACKEEGHSKLYDIVSEAFEKIADKINPENDIDWQACVTVELESPYEDYCSKARIQKLVSGGVNFKDYTSLEDLFTSLANLSLKPAPHMQECFARNFYVGSEENGRYVNSNGERGIISEEDCKEIAKYLVPEILGSGYSLLCMWEKAVEDER